MKDKVLDKLTPNQTEFVKRRVSSKSKQGNSVLGCKCTSLKLSVHILLTINLLKLIWALTLTFKWKGHSFSFEVFLSPNCILIISNKFNVPFSKSVYFCYFKQHILFEKNSPLQYLCKDLYSSAGLSFWILWLKMKLILEKI